MEEESPVVTETAPATGTELEKTKKARSSIARTLTRRTNELRHLVQNGVAATDVEEKISQVKGSMEDLGLVHDEVMNSMDESDEANLTTQGTWYDNYVTTVSQGIALARQYVETEKGLSRTRDPSVKIQRLKIPVFDSKPRKYLKWRNTFERYTRGVSDEIRYDYLLESTTGKAHNYVENRTSYDEALSKLNDEFGNKNVIMSLLIDDLRSVPTVKKGDFRAFEELAYQANSFRDRLLEMGCAAESENSYILKEIESKLNTGDVQKWLESMGDAVDVRKVEDLVEWLEKQTKLRRISSNKNQHQIAALPSNLSYPRRQANLVSFIKQQPTCFHL